MNKSATRRLPPVLRLLVFATLANAISLPCLPDDSASLASTITVASASLAVLGLFFSGQGRRLLAARLIVPGAYGLLIIILGIGLESLTVLPNSAFVFVGLISMGRLLLLAMAFWRLLADFGFEDCLGLANLVPGLTEDQRRSMAIQLWLPWYITSRLINLQRQQMNRRKLLPGPFLDFSRHWSSWQAFWYSLRHELELIGRRLEYRLPPPDLPKQLTID